MKALKNIFVALLFITIRTTLLANLPSGEIVSWGDYAPNTALLKSITNVVAVSDGFSHGLALLDDGTVFGWGSNMAGQIASALSEKTNGMIMIDGQILSNIVAVSAGARHSLVLKADGRVVAWGDNSVGQTNIPAVVSNIVTIAAGDDYSYALERDGTLVGWGRMKAYMELSNIVTIAAFDSIGLALKQDGTVLQWGRLQNQVEAVEGLSNVVAIAAGSRQNLALKQNGTVYGWGGNSHGEAIGVPTTTSRPIPTAWSKSTDKC